MRRPEIGKPQTQVTEVPPELMSSRPRPVRLTGAGKLVAGLGLLLPVAALVSASWLHESAMRGRALRDAIEREGATTDGTVMQLTRTRGKEPRFYVHFSYTAGGRLYNRRATVHRAYWTRLRPGEPVTVRYLPSKPDQAWIRGYEPRGVPFWVGPVVGASLVFFAAVIWYVLRRQRRLLEEGRGALARITRSKKISSQHGAHYEVFYEFAVLSGSVRSGRYRAMKSPPPDGATICIVYDPDQPNHSACYPLALVRVG